MVRLLQRKRITLEIKQRVVAMHYHLHSPHEHIALALGILVRSVENILHEIRTTGQLRPPGHSSEHILGRPRILDAVDVNVCGRLSFLACRAHFCSFLSG